MAAIETVTSKRVFTPDLGGTGKTTDAAAAVCAAIELISVHE
jgi:isocitrate/isopropylmalate dehydrogenase